MLSQSHIVNLDLRPAERWTFLENYREEMDELIGCYLKDFEGSEILLEGVGAYKDVITQKEYVQEIEYIASLSRFTEDQILVANLYYDILKFYFGCSAFAVEKEGMILHARNLDWHTDNNLLAKYTMVFDFQKNGQTLFKSVGWPGFVGSLSAMKPDCFSISLNAVLSFDPPGMASPITFFIREVLETSDSFEDAKKRLEETAIVSDCLLLLSGTKSGEIAVIERSPSRSATRNAESGFVVVTNDYKTLENGVMANSTLQSTSCGRYNRVHELLKSAAPASPADCLSVLQDEQVQMGITVQQMVFNCTSGELQVVAVD